MGVFSTDIPTRLGYKNLVDHADVYGMGCYGLPSEEFGSHRTYKHRNSGTWAVSIYYNTDKKIYSIEINTTYYEVTPMVKKARAIIEEKGPLTNSEFLKYVRNDSRITRNISKS